MRKLYFYKLRISSYFRPFHSCNSSINWLIPLIPTLIHRFPTPIPRIPTLISHIPTLILRISIIPLIPFPDSPFRLLQIAEFFMG